MNAKQIGGWCLIGSAAATIIGMAHHPVSYQAAAAPPVHGAMILSLLVTAFGFANFALDRDIARPSILAGTIAFAVSLFANLGAATINGFIAPALAQGGTPVAHDIFQFAWAANQALAWLGVIAIGAAFLLWSIDFLRRQNTIARLIGVAGLAAALLPTTLLVAEVLRMDVTGAFIVYAVQVAWGALVGLQLLAEGASRSAAADVAP